MSYRKRCYSVLLPLMFFVEKALKDFRRVTSKSYLVELTTDVASSKKASERSKKIKYKQELELAVMPISVRGSTKETS